MIQICIRCDLLNLIYSRRSWLLNLIQQISVHWILNIWFMDWYTISSLILN